MKFKIALLAVAGVLVLPGAAQSYFIPHVYEHQAEERTASFLHRNYASWRYRAQGYIDCDNGRLSNISWTCRVGWVAGRTCELGRVRITNEYASGGYVYYNAHFIGRRC